MKKISDKKFFMILGNASIIVSILIISIFGTYINNEIETLKREYERVSEIQTNLHEAIGKSPYNEYLLTRLNMLEMSLIKGLIGIYYHIADYNEETRKESYFNDYFKGSYLDLSEIEKTFELYELQASINPRYLKERSDSLEQKVNNLVKMNFSLSEKDSLYDQLTIEYKQLMHDQLNINTKHLLGLLDQLKFEKDSKKGMNIFFVLFQIFGLISLGISQILKDEK